ncbi:MAG: hypothetical protein IJ391_05840 [Clostridia bacterium]|nr:hypothetical protein [Clostridia bacterium]
MLNSEFYENTRLALIGVPVFVSDGERKIRYANKACKSCFAGRHFACVPNADECAREGELKLISVRFGRGVMEFYSAEPCVFGERIDVCVERSVKNSAFPILYDNTLFVAVDTFHGALHIPFFGGRVRTHQNGREYDTEQIPELSAAVSELDIKCLCIENVVADIAASFKEKVSAFGYRIDCRLALPQTPVCNVNVFDVALVCELAMTAMLKIADERTLVISLEEADGVCKIVLDIKSNVCSKEGNIRAGDVFENDPLTGKVVSSLEEVCKIYSWKLFCKSLKGRLLTVLSIPTCNYEPLRFRNVSDTGREPAVKQVTDMLSEQITSVLNK